MYNFLSFPVYISAKKLGKLNPELYRSISLDSYDFSTLAEDFMGKLYFKV